MEMTSNADAAHSDGNKAATRELGAHRMNGDERHAEPAQPSLLDRFGVIELHRATDGDTRTLERPLHHVATR